MELFCENGYRLEAVNYFCETTPSYIFDNFLNNSLSPSENSYNFSARLRLQDVSILKNNAGSVINNLYLEGNINLKFPNSFVLIVIAM